MRVNDATIAHLREFFCDSAASCEVPFLLGAIKMCGDALDIPERSFSVDVITKHRATRRTLLAMEQPHADVISWMFEERAWHPRINTLFSWPGVAVRTMTAQWGLAVEGCDERWLNGTEFAVPTGSHPSKAGVVGYLVGLKATSPIVREIQEESKRRVGAALRAYESARRGAA